MAGRHVDLGDVVAMIATKGIQLAIQNRGVLGGHADRVARLPSAILAAVE